MNQFQPVPGPSQAAFDSLSEQMANLSNKTNIYHDYTVLANGSATTFNYPSGMTQENCVIVGACYKSGNNYEWGKVNIITTPTAIYMSNQSGASAECHVYYRKM